MHGYGNPAVVRQLLLQCACADDPLFSSGISLPGFCAWTESRSQQKGVDVRERTSQRRRGDTHHNVLRVDHALDLPQQLDRPATELVLDVRLCRKVTSQSGASERIAGPGSVGAHLLANSNPCASALSTSQYPSSAPKPPFKRETSLRTMLSRRSPVHPLRALDHVVHEPLDLLELVVRAEQQQRVEVAVACRCARARARDAGQELVASERRWEEGAGDGPACETIGPTIPSLLMSACAFFAGAGISDTSLEIKADMAHDGGATHLRLGDELGEARQRHADIRHPALGPGEHLECRPERNLRVSDDSQKSARIANEATQAQTEVRRTRLPRVPDLLRLALVARKRKSAPLIRLRDLLRPLNVKLHLLGRAAELEEQAASASGWARQSSRRDSHGNVDLKSRGRQGAVSNAPRLDGPLPPRPRLRVRRRDHDIVEELDARERDARLDEVARGSGGGGDRGEGRDGDVAWEERGELQSCCGSRWPCVSIGPREAC